MDWKKWLAFLSGWIWAFYSFSSQELVERLFNDFLSGSNSWQFFSFSKLKGKFLPSVTNLRSTQPSNMCWIHINTTGPCWWPDWIMYLNLPSRESQLWLEQLCIFTRLKHSHFLHWEWTFSGNCDLIKKNTSFKNRNEDIRELIIFFPLYTAFLFQFSFGSVAQSCLTLCDPMDCSTPGLLVHHQLLKFTQTHVHWVSDAIQPFYPLFPPSPLAFNLSQHQGLFQWVSTSHHLARVLEFQLQHQSFQWTLRIGLL